MAREERCFDITLNLAALALGRKLDRETPITVRSSFAPENTESFPRRNPKISSEDITAPWAVSLLRLIHRMEAWWRGHELECLRIGVCEKDADDECFVSLYERSQLPRKWHSDESLPVKWQCEELVERLMREGKYQPL